MDCGSLELQKYVLFPYRNSFQFWFDKHSNIKKSFFFSLEKHLFWHNSHNSGGGRHKNRIRCKNINNVLNCVSPLRVETCTSLDQCVTFFMVYFLSGFSKYFIFDICHSDWMLLSIHELAAAERDFRKDKIYGRI